jgi:predicted RNA polymerase sigma factor
VRAWLTTAVARICLDELGSARARRESYVSPWLPEPVVDATRDPALSPLGLGPEDRVTLDESVSMAMLVLLESLSPAERTAFVLHEVLGLPNSDVSAVVGRSEAACRQLVARARTHARMRAPRFTPDRAQHASAVEAFLTACSHCSHRPDCGAAAYRCTAGPACEPPDGSASTPPARCPAWVSQRLGRTLVLGQTAPGTTVRVCDLPI